jgi:hypothetical protein
MKYKVFKLLVYFKQSKDIALEILVRVKRKNILTTENRFNIIEGISLILIVLIEVTNYQTYQVREREK